jgi:type I restriction enzyme S subunit
VSAQTELFESADASAVRQQLNAVEHREDGGRSLTKFIQNFRVLSEASSGIQNLKRLILRLAVAGKLVPQSDSEGTGSELLREILSKRAAFVRTPPAPPGTNELPELPKSWICTSLDSVLVVLRNGVSTRPHGDSGVPVLRISAIRPYLVSLTETRFLPGTISDYEGYFIAEGDLLFTRYSGNPEFVGACGVVPPFKGSMVHPDKLIRGVVVEHLVDPRFVSLAASAGASRAFIDDCGRTTAGQVGISGKQLKAVPMPLPPLAEQKRIVAKVDQLMALCDELEARQTKKRETGTRLTKSALEALTTAESPEEFDTAWNRVVENFDVLIDRAEQVDDLRQAILELAATARLVAPRPESASAARSALEGYPGGSRPIPERSGSPSDWTEEGGWLHAPLGAVLQEPLANGRSVPDDPAGFPVLRLSALRGRFLDFGERKLGAWTAEQAAPFVVKRGDILFVRGNGAIRLVGRACMAGEIPEPVAFPDTAIRARVRPDVFDAKWLWYVWESRVVRKQIESSAKTTAGIFKVSQDALYAVRLPVPTLREQQGIVAKVEQLMAVCDALEARLRRAEDRAAKMVEAVVRELVA